MGQILQATKLSPPFISITLDSLIVATYNQSALALLRVKAFMEDL